MLKYILKCFVYIRIKNGSTNFKILIANLGGGVVVGGGGGGPAKLVKSQLFEFYVFKHFHWKFKKKYGIIQWFWAKSTFHIFYL